MSSMYAKQQALSSRIKLLATLWNVPGAPFRPLKSDSSYLRFKVAYGRLSTAVYLPN